MKTPRIMTVVLLCCTSIFSEKLVEVTVDRVTQTGIKAVDIDAKCLEVEVVGAKTDTVSLAGAKIGQNVLVKCDKEGATLKVWVEANRGPFPWSCVGKVMLTVPEQTSVRIVTTNGDVSVDGVRGRAISAKSATGSIELSNCAAATVVKSTSGQIELDSCDGKKSIEGVSGSISVEDSDGDIYAASVSGMLDFEGIDGAIDAKSVSGMIDIDTQKGWLRLKSVSGALAGDDITAVDSCMFESKSGAIAMEFTNPLDSLSFELKSLSGRLTVGDITASKNLKTGSGSIRVVGETLSGAQDYE